MTDDSVCAKCGWPRDASVHTKPRFPTDGGEAWQPHEYEPPSGDVQARCGCHWSKSAAMISMCREHAAQAKVLNTQLRRANTTVTGIGYAVAFMIGVLVGVLATLH